MNYKEEGDKQLSAANYLEYYNAYKKYHHKTQTEKSAQELKYAKKKLELYKELCEFLKKDENKYYEVLNVKKDATAKEIRDSFTKLISKYHPDKTKIKESNSVSRIIHKAYVVLSNPKKRQEYDDSLNKIYTPRFRVREWEFTNQPYDIFRNNDYSYRYEGYNIFENEDYTIINNILYRNFFNYRTNRRLTRARWDEQVYLKLIIFLLLSYFILCV
ncbi:DnaJ-like protein [Vairimorpha necatrix]|uniref:DnaJ-like protein n=1 Tax=Vairimorpha necatrix TaxID=6039 RepID=A0AAX4JDM5_9MICR